MVKRYSHLTEGNVAGILEKLNKRFWQAQNSRLTFARIGSFFDCNDGGDAKSL